MTDITPMGALSYRPSGASTKSIGGVMSNFDQIASKIDTDIIPTINNLDNANFSASAAIDYSKLNVPDNAIPLAKLAALATGEIIAGNAGVPTKRTLSGSGALSAGGALSLTYLLAQQSFDTNLAGNGSFVDISNLSLALPAGTWVVLNTLYIDLGTTTGFRSAQSRLVDSGVTTTYNTAKVASTAFDLENVNLTLFSVITTAGGTFKVQATDVDGTGTAVCVAGANSFLLALRVA